MQRRTIISVVGALCVLLLGVAIAAAQGPDTQQAEALTGSAFTYQGRLEDGSGPISGTCNFTFRLLDGGSGEIATDSANSKQVTNGYFTAELNFGAGAFDGNERFLEINADCGDGTKTFGPQPLTPAPYALALPGLWTDPSATVPNIIGGYSGNVVDGGVSGATIGGGGGSGAANHVTGDHGTVSGGSQNTAGVRGTVGGGQNNSASANATVGGGLGNEASDQGATVSGGQSNVAGYLYGSVGGGLHNRVSAYGGTIAGGAPSDPGNASDTRNSVTDHYGTIGGGGNNLAGNDDATLDNAQWATVSGGQDNAAQADGATVGGGTFNRALGYRAVAAGGSTNYATGQYSSVGGGFSNSASDNRATVGGGHDNTASGPYSTVAGGRTNVAGSDYHATVGGGVDNHATGSEATVSGGNGNIAAGIASSVPGGFANEANGNYSLAAGYRAKAQHSGSFVWADAQKADFASTGDDQFLVRAAGGVGIGTNSPQAQFHVEATGASDEDIILGGSSGNLSTDPDDTGSSLNVDSYSDVNIELDAEDNGAYTAKFRIRNGSGSTVWSVDESGNVTNSGTQATAIETQDGDTAKVYAVQSPEQWFEDFGTGVLKNGSGTVTIAKDFAETVNLSTDYHVYLTPLGDCPLYVSDKTDASFSVSAQGNATCSIEFDYRIVAKRQGYETMRLETVDQTTANEEEQ